jgi:hypothetical protein
MLTVAGQRGNCHFQGSFTKNAQKIAIVKSLKNSTLKAEVKRLWSKLDIDYQPSTSTVNG